MFFGEVVKKSSKRVASEKIGAAATVAHVMTGIAQQVAPSNTQEAHCAGTVRTLHVNASRRRRRTFRKNVGEEGLAVPIRRVEAARG